MGESGNFVVDPTNTGQAVQRKSVPVWKLVDLTGYSRRTVYNWIGAGEVDYFRAPNGSIRIFIDSLQPKHWDRVAELVQEAVDQVQKR